MKSRTSEELSFALFRNTPRLALRFLPGFFWFFGSRQSAAFFCRPARFIDLAAAGNSQSIRRHVLRDGRTCGDVRTVPDAHGRDQGSIAADENFAPDRRRILVEAVVIAGNRARANIALRPDLRVAEVREVHGLSAFADRALLEFDKISDVRTGLQVIFRSEER